MQLQSARTALAPQVPRLSARDTTAAASRNAGSVIGYSAERSPRSSPVETVFSAVAVRILEGVDELLFSSGELRLALEAQARKMCDAIEAEPEESLKQADVDEWAAALARAWQPRSFLITISSSRRAARCSRYCPRKTRIAASARATKARCTRSVIPPAGCRVGSWRRRPMAIASQRTSRSAGASSAGRGAG